MLNCFEYLVFFFFIKQVIEKDFEITDLDRNMVLDRMLWWNLIHVADPT